MGDISCLESLLGAAVCRAQALESAIRKHRDQRGDDRCWLDDLELYALLPDAGRSKPLAKEDVVALHLTNEDDVFMCGLTEGELRDAGLKWTQLKHTSDRRAFVASPERLCSQCSMAPDASEMALPPREAFLANCARYHATRQAPGTGPCAGPPGRWVTRKETEDAARTQNEYVVLLKEANANVEKAMALLRTEMEKEGYYVNVKEATQHYDDDERFEALARGRRSGLSFAVDLLQELFVGKP